MLNDPNDKMIRKYIDVLIKKYSLDLSGRNVFTEFATGNYYYTSVIAKMAGAKTVWAYQNKVQFPYPIQDMEVAGEIIITPDRSLIRYADIITNSGYVRPIDSIDIDMMKPTAVIAMMMMKQQVNTKHVDLKYCKKKGIRCAYVDEETIGILDSIGFKTMKLCFEAGLSVWRDKFFLITFDEIGKKIKDFFEKNGIYINIWLAEQNKTSYDVVIVADYSNWRCQDFSDNDVLVIKAIIEKLKESNPNIQVIRISGDVGVDWYLDKGIKVYPQTDGNVTGDYLSYKVTLELNTAALKSAELRLT